VAQLKYLGMKVGNQSLIQEEIKRKLFQVMLATIQFRSFVFSCINIKIKIRKKAMP
jgi:hypothetical protein